MVGTSNLGSWVMAIDLRMDPNHQTLGGWPTGGWFCPWRGQKDAEKPLRALSCIENFRPFHTCKYKLHIGMENHACILHMYLCVYDHNMT